PQPTLARLPSVPPIRPTSPPAPTQAPPPAPELPAPPAPTAPPTATPGVIETEDGPVTPSMARLRLAAEPYATLGDPNAPITVVEFADFGCEFCRRHHLLTFGALRAEYIDTGKVYYVYKDLPVTSRQGALAAQAAECGGAQGRYWELHDALFAEPGAWYGGEAGALGRIRAAAEEAGLDATALEACIARGEQLANVARNFAEAQTLHIYGTPAFLINARLLAGAQPIEVWREVLDGELAALEGR
ncbi:MAG TPA: DsbA family protein, partial [Chloroflexaceae bacterium]|nr:DsbA family protein [Chloroflexaceae bacterium]